MFLLYYIDVYKFYHHTDLINRGPVTNIYASVKYVIIGSNNGPLPVERHVIT